MTEKELLNNLKSLKEVKPDLEWKIQSRDLLLSQISQGAEIQLSEDSFYGMIKSAIYEYPVATLKKLGQPIWTITAISLLVLASGVFAAVKAGQNTKPGDSFYIAKLISERAQFAMTFDDKGKALLGVDFAANRAQEMAMVMEEKSPETEKKDKIDKLTTSFKKEISNVRDTLKKMDTTKTSQVSKKENDADGKIFSANLGKDNKKIEVYNPNKAETVATSSPIVDPNNIISEAEKLFDKKQYSETTDKLNEVNELLNSKMTAQSEAKATSTDAKK